MLVNLANDDQSDAYLAGTAGREDIDNKHFLQFLLIARAMLVSFETQYHQYLNGALDRDIYLGYERSCKQQILAYPGFQMVWEITREGFSPAFAELVDRLISELNEGDASAMMRKWRQLAKQRAADRSAQSSPPS